MKIYFDNLDPTTGNQKKLTEHNGNTYWIVSAGTILKKTFHHMGVTFNSITDIDEPGCYFIDVNGDPTWWSGVLTHRAVPTMHLIDMLPDSIIKLTQNKLLRIIIAADKEGGIMADRYYDCFKTTTEAMQRKKLPIGSVLIIQGNKKIKEQYKRWLKKTRRAELFEVQYSCHFDKIFFNHLLPTSPIILDSINTATYDFNSLNRVYRSHRGAHCFYLIKNNLMSKGIVSFNQIPQRDALAASWVNTPAESYLEIMKDNFPAFVDGDWSNTNAANQYNPNVYTDSLISFITETKFNEDVVFLTEKIFKPLALGHPIILLASAGTLAGLRDLGFRTDWCGIDPGYNDIIDDKERFIKTNEVLRDWVLLPREEKIKKINQSMETINHNFELIRNENFYFQSLTTALNNSRKYFNE